MTQLERKLKLGIYTKTLLTSLEMIPEIIKRDKNLIISKKNDIGPRTTKMA